MSRMKRFLVERDIPSIGNMSITELCGAARASNQAITQVDNIQWQHSYVANDKTYCVYLSESEENLIKHSELSGIPITSITEIPKIIDPLTANN